MKIACSVAIAVMTMGALLAGCGGEPDPTPSGRSMAAPSVPDERAGNRAPVVSSVTLVPENPRIGDPITATVKASDPDSDGIRLAYQWLLNGRSVANETSTQLETGDLKKGDRVELRVVASDGRLESSPSIVKLRLGNRPPQLQGVSLPTAELRAGDPLEAGPIASDPDGDTLRFRYRWFVNGEKTGQREAEFDTTGLVRGDRIHAEVVATDGTDETAAVKSLETLVANGPPRILGVPQAREVDGEFVYAFIAEDSDGDKNLRFRLLKAPRGMRIDSATGEARWKPEADQAGSHPVEVVVEDNFGEGSALSFEVTVNVNETPAPAARR